MHDPETNDSLPVIFQLNVSICFFFLTFNLIKFNLHVKWRKIDQLPVDIKRG